MTFAGCPEILWSLLPWRYSKAYTVLINVLYSTLPKQGGWTKGPPVVFSNLTHFLILFFSKKEPISFLMILLLLLL